MSTLTRRRFLGQVAGTAAAAALARPVLAATDLPAAAGKRPR